MAADQINSTFWRFTSFHVIFFSFSFTPIRAIPSPLRLSLKLSIHLCIPTLARL